MHNLVDDPAHKGVLEQLKARLNELRRESKDPDLDIY